MKIQSLLLILPLLVAPRMQSQEVATFQLRLQDGKVLEGSVLSLGGNGLQVGLAGGKWQVAADQLLDFRGPAKLHVDGKLPLLRLHSGLELRARILGGDEDGDTIQVRGPVLGSRTLVIDAIAEILIPRKGSLADARQLVVDKADKDKERIFRRAPLGLDLIKGFLFRVSEKGVHFAPWHDEDKPQVYPWTEMAALVIPPSEELKKPAKGPQWVLLTRDGSLWRGKPVGFAKGKWLLETAIGQVGIPAASIVSGHIDAQGSRTWLSDLAPAKVTEQGLVEGETQWKDLFGFRKRRNCVGGWMRVDGVTWTQGLGAHSYSKLEFKVPAGRTRFLTQVGIDDSALRIEPSGNAAFRILLDGKKVAEIPSLKGGQGVRTFPAIPVRAGQVLTLELDFADHIYTGDRGNWLGAVFLP